MPSGVQTDARTQTHVLSHTYRHAHAHAHAHAHIFFCCMWMYVCSPEKSSAGGRLQQCPALPAYGRTMEQRMRVSASAPKKDTQQRRARVCIGAMGAAHTCQAPKTRVSAPVPKVHVSVWVPSRDACVCCHRCSERMRYRQKVPSANAAINRAVHSRRPVCELQPNTHRAKCF